MPALNSMYFGPTLMESGEGPRTRPTQANPASATTGATMVTVDGTPVRVVMLAFAAAAGLWALKLAGFKFNVGASV
ncbi:MAG TPA: hypothetical protein VM715_17280 [Candidatus Acidoferrum sp.]|jgi:hypothetical protein|nr:hypothetical protein [Candidatus Acidoferrum sp.]